MVREIRREDFDGLLVLYTPLHQNPFPEKDGKVLALWERILGDADILVACQGDEVCAFAVVQYVTKPLSPYNLERRFYQVEEFGVDEAHRRQGFATALVKYMRQDATAKGFDRIELDMWKFNQGALKFYESVGFSTYRRYMELSLDGTETF